MPTRLTHTDTEHVAPDYVGTDYASPYSEYVGPDSDYVGIDTDY